MAAAAGMSQNNPITGEGTNSITFPALTIPSSGPGTDAPVWYRTADGTTVEIEVQGAELAGFNMPGEMSSGPIIIGPGTGGDDIESVEIWYDNGGTWVESELSPFPPGTGTDFPSGVTKIQLRGIDRSSADPEENLFNAGLIFNNITDDVTVTISNASADINSSMTLNVESGWNLISLYLQSTNTAVADVLGSIDGNYISVWAYTDNKWEVYDPENQDFSDLDGIVPGKGYWINMDSDSEITISGTASPGAIDLSAGWNLVGYNSSESQNTADAISSISGNIVSIWRYKEARWEVYDPQSPDFSDLTIMEPGYGYWFNISSPCSWEQ